MKKFLIVLLSLAIFIALSCNGYFTYQLYQAKSEQDEQIQELNKELALLQANVNQESQMWNTDGYNYLAIGNSITIHGYADYWWDDDRGMAASEDSKDFVHLVQSYLDLNGKDVTMHAESLLGWEANGNDRAEFLTLMDSYLYEGLDLITIQLGENAYDLNSYESDFEDLISYVKQKCPNAQILVVGDFWVYSNRDYLKQQAAEAQNVTYVSLYGIKGNSYYYAGIGTSVEDKYGEFHIIDEEGVSIHPGDRGMAAIAERITEQIDLTK